MKKSAINLDIINNLEDLTINYQFLFEKTDNFNNGLLKKLQNLRESMEGSYENMNKDYTSLLLSGDESRTPEKLDEINKKYQETYYNHLNSLQILEEDPKKTQEMVPTDRKSQKIIRELSEKLEEVTNDYDILKKVVEENNKKLKKSYPVSEKEINLYKDKSYNQLTLHICINDNVVHCGDTVVKNPSLEVQLAAVRQSGLAVEYIKNPSLEVQCIAVKQGGSSIKYIENSSLEVQLTVVRQNGNIINYIKKTI
jgi:hypothetical protein